MLSGETKLIVIIWSDGSMNPFFAGLETARDCFVDWKINKYPDIAYQLKEMTVDEYNKNLDKSSK